MHRRWKPVVLIAWITAAGLAQAQRSSIPLVVVPRMVYAVAEAAVNGLEFSSAEVKVKHDRTVYELHGAANGLEYEVDVAADGELLEIATAADTELP
jgi:uncharacterized membrane protein YkoI